MPGQGRRRHVTVLAAGAALAALVPALWMLDHLRPRHGHFETRRGAIVEATVTDDASPVPEVHVSSARLRASTGLVLDMRVLRPAELAERVPVIVLIGGHRTGRDAVTLIGNPGGVAVVALDYPFHGPERIRGLLHATSELGHVQQAILDTPPAISTALDWLLDQPWVDAARAELVGVSLGTPFVAVAGALDDRFQRVWFLHGGADNRDWLDRTLGQSLSNPLLRLVTIPVVHLLAHGASFDTGSWARRIAPRPVVVVGATSDEQLPRANVERLYLAAGEPKELIWADGGHVSPQRPDSIHRLLNIVRARVGSP